MEDSDTLEVGQGADERCESGQVFMCNALFPLPNLVSLAIDLGHLSLGHLDVQALWAMMLQILVPLTIGLGLTALIGFFVAAELSLVASSAPDIEALAIGVDAHPNARLLLDAKRNLERYLSVTQTGTTAGSLLLGWLGESSIVRWLDPLLGRLSRLMWVHGSGGSGLTGVGAWLSHVWAGAIGLSSQLASQISGHAVAVALAFLLVTYIEIVLGELVPKVLAAHAPESTALMLIRPLRWFLYLFFPALVILDASVRTLVRPLGLRLGPDAPALHLHPVAAMQLTAPRVLEPANGPSYPDPEADPLEQ
jgi:CBS domain containing-hemolysin-like protein